VPRLSRAPLTRVEIIRKCDMLDKKLYSEDSEVTPTMNVKCKYISAAYEDTIEALYREN
jgi:long-subunit acyl-CoA synthetase (AMP-forming)